MWTIPNVTALMETCVLFVGFHQRSWNADDSKRSFAYTWKLVHADILMLINNAVLKGLNDIDKQLTLKY